MERTIEETAAERRAYVNQIRASFQNQAQGMSANEVHNVKHREQISAEQGDTMPSVFSGLGFRTILAILLFAAFVYCDQEKITFQQYETKDVISQIEWDPLPLDELKEVISIQP